MDGLGGDGISITAQLFFFFLSKGRAKLCTLRLRHRAILQKHAHASCIHKTCDSDDGEDLRQLPLAGIAPERARGPERGGGVDPGGLRGFAHLGLHVWVDLRGRGRQLSACHGSPPPPRALPLQRQADGQAADTFPAPLAAVGTVRAHSEAPADQKTKTKKKTRVPRLSGAAQGRRGSVWLPAASRAPQTH